MKVHWTDHSKIKMRQYGLSKSKLMRLIERPERKEGGIAPGTVAVMMQNSKSKILNSKQIQNPNFPRIKRPPGEIWLMYKDEKGFRKIISAWRYPGVSKPGEAVPIPEDIRQELSNL